jgi:hypothetical protein
MAARNSRACATLLACTLAGEAMTRAQKKIEEHP